VLAEVEVAYLTTIVIYGRKKFATLVAGLSALSSCFHFKIVFAVAIEKQTKTLLNLQDVDLAWPG